MYNIVFSDTALKQFKKIEKPLQERIISALERIRTRPENFVKKLVGEPYFKLRIGDYRAILDIRNKESIITVIVIGHRRNIYDLWARR